MESKSGSIVDRKALHNSPSAGADERSWYNFVFLQKVVVTQLKLLGNGKQLSITKGC